MSAHAGHPVCLPVCLSVCLSRGFHLPSAFYEKDLLAAFVWVHVCVRACVRACVHACVRVISPFVAPMFPSEIGQHARYLPHVMHDKARMHAHSGTYTETHSSTNTQSHIDR